jgi:hypothetical protein
VRDAIIDVFAKMGQDKKDDAMFYYWDNSLVKGVKPTKIPFTLVDETRKSALTDSPWGLRHFHPWFLSPRNSGANDDFLKIMVDLLAYNDDLVRAKKYWFFRGDLNIFKMWMKVISGSFFYIDFFP